MTTRWHGTGGRLLVSVRPHVKEVICSSSYSPIGKTLAMLLEKALHMQTKHCGHHRDLSLTFPEDVVAKWERMVAEWNADPKKKNPYVEVVAGMDLQFLGFWMLTIKAQLHPWQHFSLNLQKKKQRMLKRVNFVHMKLHPVPFYKLVLISKINSKCKSFFSHVHADCL
jgi:hypothetical protein